MRKMLVFRICAALCVSVCAQVASAQVCQNTVGGNYSYSAIGMGLPGSLLTSSTTTGTGTPSSTGTTTSTTPAFTNSEVGLLLGGLTGTVPFATPGTLFFDGSGNIRGTLNSQGGATINVGTYVVNSDCTITVTLTDTFGNNKTSATLQGIVLSNGAEIDLGVLSNSSTSTGTTSGNGTTTGPGTTSTTTTGTTATALAGSSTLITLVRPLANFCYTSNLAGPYALVGIGSRAATIGGVTGGTGTTGTGTGTATASGQTIAPFFFLARVVFDGNGNVVSQSGTPSSLSFLQFTGTYTVNTDCSGTMMLNTSNSTGTGTGTTTTNGTGTTTTTGTGTTSGTTASTLSVSFVLTQPMVPFSGGTPAVGGSTKPGIQFSVFSNSQTLYGYGRAQ